VAERGARLVGVDSEAVKWEQARTRTLSKMVPLAHANAVLAARGNSLFFNAMLIQMLNGGDDFDQLCDSIDAHICNSLGEIGHFLATNGLGSIETIGKQTLVLVGWSPRFGRVLGEVFEVAAGLRPLQHPGRHRIASTLHCALEKAARPPAGALHSRGHGCLRAGTGKAHRRLRAGLRGGRPVRRVQARAETRWRSRQCVACRHGMLRGRRLWRGGLS
jgi:hypothetical protein